jgi:signal transduction histidine kinase
MSRHPSPTPALLFGLVITLTAVAASSAFVIRQVTELRRLQSDLAERNRKDSLQLLRIQNNLNLLGLAMRDMLDTREPYPLTAWSAQLQRIRGDLDDALRREEELAVTRRTPEQSRALGTALAQLWDAVDRMFAEAARGDEQGARTQIRVSLQARQASLSAAVARLLVENNVNEEQTAQRVQESYTRIELQVYGFSAAALVAIVVTSLSLIRSNRRLFAEIASLSDQRRELAQKLIAARETTLHHISRELHDELGQILTAMGSMLSRAGKHAPEGSPLRTDLREVCEMVQTTLDNVRSLSQTLHPAILDEAGLESAVDWYLSTVEKQLGVKVSYERDGTPVPVDGTTAIHVYRVLQESLSNVARHAATNHAWVRLRYAQDAIELEVEDHGKGMAADPATRGLGVVAMRERAALLGGTIEFVRPAEGGTCVRLRVPM